MNYVFNFFGKSVTVKILTKLQISRKLLRLRIENIYKVIINDQKNTLDL